MHCYSSNEKEREISCRLGFIKLDYRKNLLFRYVRLYQEHTAGWARQKGSRALHGTFKCSKTINLNFVQYFNLSPMSLTNETKIEELRKVIELFPKVMQEVSLLSDHYDFKIC